MPQQPVEKRPVRAPGLQQSSEYRAKLAGRVPSRGIGAGFSTGC